MKLIVLNLNELMNTEAMNCFELHGASIANATAKEVHLTATERSTQQYKVQEPPKWSIQILLATRPS